MIERAMAVVAQCRAAREREMEMRRKRLARIDLSTKPKYVLKNGVQLQLKLNG
ncbi:hypothetical protein LJR030_000103 [Rhizobium sp. LjRoot30]|uniref:hypothetical protein n=1 Tax=Rhizobium sp. LjRoot30 TaxID=3342320 RepID=UPI003ED16FD7